MDATSPSLDLLWNLSEIERKLSAKPDAKGYLKLAAGYAEAGWAKEATRAAQRAAALTKDSAVAEGQGASYAGPCTPRVLVELLRSLHLTGKSGEFRLEAPGGVSVVLLFVRGRLVDAQSSDAPRGEASLLRAASLRASQYSFFAGKPRQETPSLEGSTVELLARLGSRVTG